MVDFENALRVEEIVFEYDWVTQVRSDEGFSISGIETSLSTIGPSLGPGPGAAISDCLRPN